MPSRVHGSMQVFQTVFPLPLSLLREKIQLSRPGTAGREGGMAALTLSFLNSSYSGLSVGSSRRQSGQEFVCKTFCVTILRHEFYLKTAEVTFPNQGKIHPEWKRCLQGISRTVSCSSNSSKHTGHLRPLSVQTQHKTEETCLKYVFGCSSEKHNVTVSCRHLLALGK